MKQDKIRVLVISPFFYPHIGGSQRYMEEIYSTLVKNYKGIRVDVLCYNTDIAKIKEEYKDLNIYRVPCYSILPGQFALPNPVYLFKFLWNRKYNLIHCSTRFFDSSWWTPLYAKVTGAKIFLTDHCGDYPKHRSLLISAIAKIIDKVTSLIFLKMYDKVFSTNKHTENFLQNEFGIKSKVIYGGAKISGKNFKKKIQVLFVGRMIDSKGPKLLFKIAKKFKNLKFIFVGPGNLVRDFQEEAGKLKIKNVKILGPISHAEVLTLMSRSLILVHPSYHSEGFPNVLTEAGARKMVVIATDVGGTREIILNNKTGILVKPKDEKALENALKKLMKNRKLSKKLAENLYKHVTKNFRWEKSARRLYQELINLKSA